MTPLRRSSDRLASDAGFTVIEMMVSTAIMVIVLAGIFQALNPSQGAFSAQPEITDMQQRLRVGVDTLNRDLVMAGAGTYSGKAAGSLSNFFAPVLPYRTGDLNPDPPGTFRDDVITLLYVPTTASQTAISQSMPPTANELKVYDQPQCPKNDALCGFKEGMQVLIFDDSGSWNSFTITEVQNNAGHLQRHGPDLVKSYDINSNVTQIETNTYWWNRATNQMMHYDSGATDLPVVDNVVALRFEYFGDPQPPTLIKPTNEDPGPWTTYGPKPPRLTQSVGNDYPVGENCAFQVVSNQQVPRLPDLSPGSTALVPLTADMLTDGPWCPDAKSPQRFDADLFRIRRVRVTLRVQTGVNTLRGMNPPGGPVFFTNPTTKAASALATAPDQEVKFDVAPRNMNLGR